MLNRLTKKFLLNENMRIDPLASIQALTDIISNVRTTNKRDSGRIQLAKEHVKNIKRQIRSLNEKVIHLEEQLNLLNEEK